MMTPTLPLRQGRQRVGRYMWVAFLTLIGAVATAHADNDDLADALVLSGALPLTSSGISNVAATAEVDEPDHDFNSIASHSMWYKWTAPSTMAVELNTFGSVPSEPTPGLEFDTVLAIYTGSNMTSLVRIAGSDDDVDPANSNTKQSRTRFIAQAGTTYMIAVDGFTGEKGSIVLNILAHTAARPSNDNWANAEFLTGALPQTNDQSPTSTTNSTVNATVEHDEPYHVSVGNNSTSVWFAWTATTSGSIAAHTTGSDFDTVLSVYRGSSLGELTLITNNDDDGAGAQSSVLLYAELGTTYYFAVDGFESEEGQVLFDIEWGPSAPPNDKLTDAEYLGSWYTTNTDGPSGGATKELGEPDHVSGLSAYSSVWYSWTAPPDVNDSVEVNTFGSNFDTVLAVYTGTSIANISKVASNDDAGLPQSRVRFSAIPSTTYLIAVDGRQGGQGAVFLEIKPGPTSPANDNFANAHAIDQRSFIRSTGNNFGATVEGSEPEHDGSVVADGSVWFRWTANADSKVKVTTEDSDFDTVLAVYSGSTLSTLTQLAANNNAGGLQSQVTFVATQGEDYYIAVAGNAGAEGNIELDISAVGSYAAWLEVWPSLTGNDRKHAADKDGDGFSNLVEMLCGLDPTMNSRPGGSDPNYANAPTIVITDLASFKICFKTDPTYVNATHNGGSPITFGGRLYSGNLTPGGPVTPSITGPNSYQIASNIVTEAYRFMQFEVHDPNG